MFIAWRMFLKRDLDDHVPHRWSPFAFLIFVFFELTAYWYTAQAFASGFESKYDGLDYFSFIVIGEVFLQIPLMALTALVQHTKKYTSEGLLDSFLMLPVPPQRILISSVLSALPRQAFYGLMTLILAATLFELQGEPWALPYALIYQIAALPVFIGLGLLVTSFLVYFGRGQSLVNYLQMGFAIFSGAYFPIEVFTEPFYSLARYASPLTLILNASRNTLSQGGLTGADLMNYLLPLILWGLFFLPLGYWSLGFSFRALKKSGRPLYIFN